MFQSILSSYTGFTVQVTIGKTSRIATTFSAYAYINATIACTVTTATPKTCARRTFTTFPAAVINFSYF